MGRNRYKRLVYSALFLLAVIALIAMQAFGFFTDTNSRTNRAVVGANEAAIVETFTAPETVAAGDAVTKSVRVKNTGIESYVRMFIAISDSKYEDSFTMNISPEWVKAQDGYYYYKSKLAKGGTTSPIFDTLTFTKALPADSGLEIICYAETVQAQGFKTAEEAFKEIN